MGKTVITGEAVSLLEDFKRLFGRIAFLFLICKV